MRQLESWPGILLHLDGIVRQLNQEKVVWEKEKKREADSLSLSDKDEEALVVVL